MFQTYQDRKKLYNSKTWKNIRQIVLERDNYECVMCKAEGKVTHIQTKKQLDIDHIKSLETHPKLAFDLNNLQTLCVNHHNLKEGRHWKQKQKRWNDERWD